MVQVKDLTEVTLEDLWREVKWQSEDWWEEIEVSQLRMVKTILESSLEGVGSAASGNQIQEGGIQERLPQRTLRKELLYQARGDQGAEGAPGQSN